MTARRGRRAAGGPDDGLWGCFSAEEVEACLQRGEHPERPDPHGGLEGQTPLHRACRSGLAAVASALLRAGANPATVDCHGESPLHALLALQNLTNPQVQQRILIALLKHDAPVGQTDTNGNSALHLAALKGNLGFCELLINAGGDMGIPNLAGETPADILLEAMPRLGDQAPWRERLLAVELGMTLPQATSTPGRPGA